MGGRRWIVVAAALGFALAAGAGCAQQQQAIPDEGCAKTCYEELDACSRRCANDVDNDMCSQECLYEKDKCIARCG